MKGNAFVKLRITGQNLDFEQLNRELSHQPSFSYRKGDSHTPKIGDKQSVIYKEDCWIFEIEKHEDETIDNMLYGFLTEFKQSQEYLKSLSDNDVTLWVSVYPDELQSDIHLENKTLKLLADMGLSVDFYVMFLNDFYDGTYKR